MFGLTHGEVVMASLTAIYVGLTGFYAWTSHQSLKAIKRQADLTEQQVVSSATQFQEQLAAMEDARKQTDQLIAQAGAQAAALTKAAEAAEKSAVAAKVSADSITNSERAWIVLDIELVGGRVEHVTLGDGIERTCIRATYTCKNVGRSPAWVTERIVDFQILDSGSSTKMPDIEMLGPFEYGPKPLKAGEESVRGRTLECEGRPGHGKFTRVLGVVKYRDIFGKERVTVCGYMLSPDEKNLERMAGPDYNQYT